MICALSRRAALSLPALLAAPAIGYRAIPHANENPDADLIRYCDEFMTAQNAYNYDSSNGHCEDDPLWHALVAATNRLKGLEAQTMAGVVAKARVALHQAKLPDGAENFDTSFTGDWPEQVVRDLLRLAERGQA